MSKNLNRKFFYDFLIRLATDAKARKDDKSPLNVEDGEATASNGQASAENNDEPPPLMQGTPRKLPGISLKTLKRIHTA